MDENCLFCKIGAKKIPSKIVYEDDEVFAFEDISPQAPTHVLICPRKHFSALHDASSSDQALLGKLQLVAAKLAQERNLLAGYRTVLNNGGGRRPWLATVLLVAEGRFRVCRRGPAGCVLRSGGPCSRVRP